MSNALFENVYNPDVLSCLANLSNDEVFTPPDVVNKMLDMLPQELFRNPDTTFLDPACKTGMFLREIAKRLIIGLGAADSRFAGTRRSYFSKTTVWYCHYRADKPAFPSRRVLLQIPEQRILGEPL